MGNRLGALWPVLGLLAGCDGTQSAAPAPSHARYGELLESVAADRTLLGRAWLAAAEAALREATPIALPYAESGAFLAHEPSALGLTFTGGEGQTLRLTLARLEAAAATPGGALFAELFRVEELRDRTRHVWLGVLPPDEAVLEVELPEDAVYVVRVQPELLTDAQYHLTLELGAVLPFPVSGFGSDAVQSFFGVERDAGARHHEGVDIFAPRSTPVLAVADGRAMARENKLGGNTVWLSTPGTSYYYAHLERAALSGAQQVRAGDVLGYVGNTGNAANTVPHLHFGVYRWGKGPIDPLPLLGAHHFADPRTAARFTARYVTTVGSTLNLRRAPSRASAIIDQLPAASVVHATAASGEWLRVRIPAGGMQTGWIHSRYSAGLDAALREWRAPAPTFLFDSIGAAAAVVDFVPAGAVLDVLAERDRHLLLRNAKNSRTGWHTPRSAAIGDRL